LINIDLINIDASNDGGQAGPMTDDDGRSKPATGSDRASAVTEAEQ